MEKLKAWYLRNKAFIFGVIAAFVPFLFYIITLERKLVGGDTSWYAVELPQMMLLPPTGYPVFSMIGKFFSMIPIGPLALRLNLISAVFGSLTILFLFMSINKILKNEILSLIASFSFAFVYPFWFYANRLEFDTLNSFYIAILIFAILKYQENSIRKNLYFCFVCLGFFLTNHPIAFFIMPFFLILIIIIKPEIFKSFKSILFSILLFIFPLLSYSYIYIRSIQGYGKINTLLKFIYFVTGREETGATFGGSFGDKQLFGILKVVMDYLELIKESYGIVLIVIAVIGFIILFKKNWKFALFSFLVILGNLFITTQYLDWAVLNYTLNIMLIISFYIGCGFLFFWELFKIIFDKLYKNKNISKKYIITKNISFIILILLFATQPIMLIAKNYEKCNFKTPRGIYSFWDNAYKSMDKNAKLYAYSASVNIAVFIGKYEQSEKNIQLIGNNENEYTYENITSRIENGIPVYFVGNDKAINQIFVTEKIGKPYYWERYNEELQLYKITKSTPKVVIESFIRNEDFKFGKDIIIEYKINNNSSSQLKIDSIELKLPKELKFYGVLKDGYIKQDPGISQGKYMWVSDDYVIQSESNINLILKLMPTRTGNFDIELRLTTGGVYFDAKKLSFQID